LPAVDLAPAALNFKIHVANQLIQKAFKAIVALVNEVIKFYVKV
jgi:hypothetical protein